MDPTLALTVVGTVITAVSVIAGYRGRRPNPRQRGGGHGERRLDGRNFCIASIGIVNDPSFWRLRLGRKDAVDLVAHTFDPYVRRHVGHLLLWEDQQGELSERITLQAGESARLFVAGKEVGSDDFFLYSAQSQGDVPDILETYSERARHFEIRLTDREGRRFKVPVIVEQNRRSVSVRSPKRLRWRVINTEPALARRWRSDKRALPAPRDDPDG